MPIKNYTTRVPAAQSIKEIQDALVDHGAKAVLFEYEKDTGRIEKLLFKLTIQDNDVNFSLPCEWRKFQAVLKEQGVSRHNDEDYVYRVAWRCIRDWVMAQLALYETQIVEIPQVFLPFAVDAKGETIYQRLMSGNLLGAGEAIENDSK